MKHSNETEPIAQFLEISSRFELINRDDDDVQYLTFRIQCDRRYSGAIENIGIRVFDILNRLDEDGGEDDGEWKDDDGSYLALEKLRTQIKNADICINGCGEYSTGSGGYFEPGEIATEDLSISYKDTYFLSKATALIAFVPIAKVKLWDNDYNEREDTIVGEPFVCRIGHGGPQYAIPTHMRTTRHDKERIEEFLRQGKLIRAQHSFNYPDYPWVGSND